MAKQVMDFSSSKGFSSALSTEEQRTYSQKGWEDVIKKGNYDRTREHLNFEIVAGGKVQAVDKTKSIDKKIMENLDRRHIEDPNEGLKEPKYRTVVNFIFGGSREQMRKLAFGEQKINEEKGADNSQLKRDPQIENWARDIYSFMAKKYGEENIASFIVHLDELNPHIHCTLLPICDNKFNYKKIFAGKNKFEFGDKSRKLHNELAEVNAKYGLERGSNIIETGARHKTTEEYRRELNETNRKLSEHIESQKKLSEELDTQNKIAEKRVKGLTTMIENLTSQKTKIEEEIDSLKKQGDTSSAKVRELQEQLRGINDKIDDKQMKLARAQELLGEVLHHNKEVKEVYEENKRQLDKMQEKKETVAQGFIAAGALDELAEYVGKTYPNLSDEEKENYDNSFISNFAERPAELIGCATALFLNYIDAATSIAKTSGGGGGPGSGWGKKDGEDDEAWIHRCLREAAKMMGRGRKRGISR